MAMFVDHSCMSEYGCPVSITVEYNAEINQNTGQGGEYPIITYRHVSKCISNCRIPD